jgi:hypothetical protein
MLYAANKLGVSFAQHEMFAVNDSDGACARLPGQVHDSYGKNLLPPGEPSFRKGDDRGGAALLQINTHRVRAMSRARRVWISVGYGTGDGPVAWSCVLVYEPALAWLEHRFPGTCDGALRRAIRRNVRACVKLVPDKRLAPCLAYDMTIPASWTTLVCECWQTFKLCSRCAAPAVTVEGRGRHRTCEACHHVAYCSRRCQRAHWKAGHRDLRLSAAMRAGRFVQTVLRTVGAKSEAAGETILTAVMVDVETHKVVHRFDLHDPARLNDHGVFVDVLKAMGEDM